MLRTLRPEAELLIGDDVGMSGAVICAAYSISIGSRVLLGSEVLIVDTDFHPLEPTGRRFATLPEPQPEDRVEIGDDVFIGARAMVLKGSTIGRGSVIGAGSVVCGLIPPNCIAAGVPAKVIGPVPASPPNK